jgi:hypothetical protein
MRQQIIEILTSDAKNARRLRAFVVFCVAWFLETIRHSMEGISAVRSVNQAFFGVLFTLPVSFICAWILMWLTRVVPMVGLRRSQLWAVVILTWATYDLLSTVYQW